VFSTVKHLTLFVALSVATPSAFAQSPFQSAPGPAPITRRAPRPAPNRQQPEDQEPPPSVATVPAAPAPAPAPPPPPPLSLAGVWHFRSNCPLDPGADLTLTQSSTNQYLISGSAGIIPFAVNGWVNGKLVHMEADPPLNHIVSQGTVTSPTTMNGNTTQTFMGITCSWVSQKK
jgi:hypothetical protein